MRSTNILFYIALERKNFNDETILDILEKDPRYQEMLLEGKPIRVNTKDYVYVYDITRILDKIAFASNQTRLAGQVFTEDEQGLIEYGVVVEYDWKEEY